MWFVRAAFLNLLWETFKADNLCKLNAHLLFQEYTNVYIYV